MRACAFEDCESLATRRCTLGGASLLVCWDHFWRLEWAVLSAEEGMRSHPLQPYE